MPPVLRVASPAAITTRPPLSALPPPTIMLMLPAVPDVAEPVRNTHGKIEVFFFLCLTVFHGNGFVCLDEGIHDCGAAHCVQSAVDSLGDNSVEIIDALLERSPSLLHLQFVQSVLEPFVA